MRAVEPYAETGHIPAGLDLVDLTERELAGADAVVVLTDHDAFDYRLVERVAPYVFETRNRCSGDHVERI
jgi:UDP-N-acetyl-D-glucosamine dehydrogenase